MTRRLLFCGITGVILFIGFLPILAADTSSNVKVNKWRIPFITVLTGSIAHIGLEVQWAANLAAEEINAAGGIAGKPIELVVCDTGFDAARAVSCMKEAVNESPVVIGPLSTMDVRASAAIAAKEEVMTLPVASSIAEVGKVYPWAVVFIPSMDLICHVVLDWLKLNPDIQSVVIFKDPKNPVWIEEADLYKKYCESAGVKVLDTIDVAADAVDTSAAVIRAMGRKPEALIMATEHTQTARLIVELNNRGWKNMSHIACHSNVSTPSFFEVGGQIVNGVYVIGLSMDFDYPAERWQNFLKAFGRAHKGAKPAMYVMPYYDVVYAVKEAIEKTGVTGDPGKLKEERLKIRDYIRNLKEFPGIYKPFTMDEKGWAHTDVIIGQIQEGVVKAVPQK
jgi:branched-chain amino acid transport system substrate-binding protein